MATKKSSKSASKKGAKKSTSSSSAPQELRDLFEEILKDTYNAEKQLVKALPKMAKAATSEELAAAFEDHLEVTENQVTRLEQVFESCGLKVSSKKCEAMAGLVKEGEEAVEETEDGSLLRDVALIIAAQKVEHYEIAAYGSLRTLAMIMGEDDAASLLQETLDEEGETDHLLTEIAESINPEAYREGMDEEDEDMEEDEAPVKTSRKSSRR